MKNFTEAEAARGDEQFVANGIRLDGRGWLVALIFMVALFVLVPPGWKGVETFETGPDYRIPQSLSEDYWLYDRWARRAAESADTLVVGDSVVWGEYVAPDETLTHYLNEVAGGPKYANLGLAGMHPTPLAGLIDSYGDAISGKDVILHCNPLWMSSPRHDLSEEKEFAFNHPDLVPQFFPRIPCYKRGDADRLGVLLRRNLSFLGWTRHLQVAYFDQQDIPAWTLDHPSANPLSAITMTVPSPGTTLRHPAGSWTTRGIRPVSMNWVDLETSIQWTSFRRLVDILEKRGNDLFVVVGPFNEHLLTERGREAYARVKGTIVSWLEAQKIPHLAPEPLPSELYADASHPLAAGYALMAKQLYENRRSLDPAKSPSRR